MGVITRNVWPSCDLGVEAGKQESESKLSADMLKACLWGGVWLVVNVGVVGGCAPWGKLDPLYENRAQLSSRLGLVKPE